MNLTKGRISKLYSKQRQTHKKYHNKKADIKSKTFRKKVNNNLAIKTLKNIKYYKIKGGSDQDQKVMSSVNTLIDYLTDKIANKMNYSPKPNLGQQEGFDSINKMANTIGNSQTANKTQDTTPVDPGIMSNASSSSSDSGYNVTLPIDTGAANILQANSQIPAATSTDASADTSTTTITADATAAPDATVDATATADGTAIANGTATADGTPVNIETANNPEGVAPPATDATAAADATPVVNIETADNPEGVAPPATDATAAADATPVVNIETADNPEGVAPPATAAADATPVVNIETADNPEGVASPATDATAAAPVVNIETADNPAGVPPPPTTIETVKSENSEMLNNLTTQKNDLQAISDKIEKIGGKKNKSKKKKSRKNKGKKSKKNRKTK